ncbi:Detected protein of unknown function [Hibiscus syriacus]|uniref:COP1-interacting protein 7 n=1 Tax=Hibiscus syriacus TaxID=106335 RepID=A0A6A2XYA4_HIBSY|nr:Detected protein of unknown function [Hibiscus syriacus]
MKSDRLIDYAVFQLSPKSSRCELFVSSNGITEKLASGFVRFVSTPEVLELVNTLDAEMSQLEAARRIYSQGVGDQPSGALGGDNAGMMAAADATKKELLRAIDVRLTAVQQDLAKLFLVHLQLHGFTHCWGLAMLLVRLVESFGVVRLAPNSYHYAREDQTDTSGVNDQVVRASWGSDMSIDDPDEDQNGSHVNSRLHQPCQNKHQEQIQPNTMQTQPYGPIRTSHISTTKAFKYLTTASLVENKEEEKKKEGLTESSPSQISQPSRRLSVQDRINLFENKQKETSGGVRRWSGASDMSIDLGLSDEKEQRDMKGLTDKVSSIEVKPRSAPNKAADSGLKDQGEVQSQVSNLSEKEKVVGLSVWISRKDQLGSQSIQYQSFTGKSEQDELGDQVVSQEKVRGPITGKRGDSEVQSGGFPNKAAIDGVINQPTSQLQWKSFTGEVEEVGMEDLASSERQMRKTEDSGIHKMKFKKQCPSGSSRSNYEDKADKGKPELNDELKMKANELEKLFAEHKLRAPGDQFSSARRSKPADEQIEQEGSSQYKKPVALDASPSQLTDKNSISEPMESTSNIAKFYTPTKDNQDYADNLRLNFSSVSFSVDSRGKFYERYMQKRDAKLREEWSSKRGEKEAKLKAMQDILEQNRTEMKAKFSGSDRQSSISSARRQAEKGRSFNLRLQREQHPISSIQSKDEDLSEFPDHQYYGQDRSYNEASLFDGSSRSSNSKKVLPNRNVSLSTPRTTAVTVPRSAAKASNPTRFWSWQDEQPLQVRKYDRSKSNNEEISLGKDDQSRRSQSNRKISSGHVEFSDVPALNSVDVALEPKKFDKEQTGQSFNDNSLKNVEAKPYLWKESDELAFEADDSMDIAKEDEEDELETMAVNSADMENGRSRLSQESDKLDNSGSENGDSMRSLSQVDPKSVAELPAAALPTFHNIDASMDSPIGSPASGNSHSLAQTGADSARMRKKWGSAQKPFLVANATHNQPRKDVTKGFKRLLKFGRKSRGTDSLVDWISATTSEGDDDTEDGRDPASRSSEDLRKSRMGFPQGPF